MTPTTAASISEVRSGPLKFPRQPEHTRHRRALERLRGHTTADWIPVALSDELDELRGEMLKLRARAQESIDAITALDRQWRTEDRAQNLRLKHAARTGTEAEDKRTDEGERLAAEDSHVERMWATVEVMAEIADKVVATVRDQEPSILADLRGQLTAREEAVRELERRLREAREQEWQTHKLGQWVMGTAEDKSFGRQPAPTPEPMPANFNSALLKISLERPWFKPLPRTAA
jgi:hypothetical protein